MEDAREMYRTWLDGVWSGDADAAVEVVAEDFVGHWPSGEVRGRDALLSVVHKTHGMFDQLDFQLAVGPVVDGDLVAARWLGTGARAGERTRFIGHDLLRLDHGAVVEYWPATVTLPDDPSDDGPPPRD